MQVTDPRTFKKTSLWEVAKTIYLFEYDKLENLLTAKSYNLNELNEAGVPVLSMAIAYERDKAIHRRKG